MVGTRIYLTLIPKTPIIENYYRPQGKVMFSQASVCPQSVSWLFGHCVVGTHPSGMLLFSNLLSVSFWDYVAYSLADLGGRARRAPPHLPGILVFDDILGHIALADLGGRARCAPPHLPGILVFDDILGHIV